MDPQHQTPQPSARRLSRAAAVIFAIFIITVVAFFLGRVVWHEEEQSEDPASVEAPDQTGRP